MDNRHKMKTYSRKNSSYLKKAFIASNFNEMCRLCLSELDLGLTPIIQSSDRVNYQEQIEFGVDIKVQEGDGLPSNICVECRKMVEQTYLFKKKCKANDSKLREHMQLLEQDDEQRHNELVFSGLEDERNLFKRNESTQSSSYEFNPTDSGGTAQDAPETSRNSDDDDDEVRELLGENDEEGIEKNEYSFKDVTNMPKGKKEVVMNIINDERTEGSEEQFEVIAPKSKASQGNKSTVVRFILKGEKKRTQDDDEEEDLSIFEIVPLEKSDDSPTFPESKAQEKVNGKDTLCSDSQGEKSETTLQQIYEQWECDNSQESLDAPSNIHYLFNYDHYNSSDDGSVDDISVAYDNHDTYTLERPEQYTTTQLFQSHPTIQQLQGEDTSPHGRKRPTGLPIQQQSTESDPFQVNRIYKTRNEISIIETIPSVMHYTCCNCPQKFPSLPELKQHLTSAHQISESSSCEICFKTFTCVNSLRRHMMVHAGFKPHKCRICRRRFSQTSTLKRHVLTHEASKPYVCQKCNKSYTQKMSLVTHLKTHGVMKTSYIYTCQSCNKSFAHQSGLSRHLKQHKGYRFVCVDCMRSFVDPSALTRHVKRLHQKKNQRSVMNLRPRDRIQLGGKSTQYDPDEPAG